MKTADIATFFAALKAANPQPQTELEYSSVFELLCAVLLSAQVTDVGVNKATRRLFPLANTPQKILALGQDGLEAHIRTIGLYRSKARHLLQTCRILVEQHGGEVPRQREALEALPGVGGFGIGLARGDETVVQRAAVACRFSRRQQGGDRFMPVHVPMMPPSDFRTTTVAERGRPPAGAGHDEMASGFAGSLRSLGGSPGCWMLRNMLRPSGDHVRPVISQPAGPVR